MNCAHSALFCLLAGNSFHRVCIPVETGHISSCVFLRKNNRGKTLSIKIWPMMEDLEAVSVIASRGKRFTKEKTLRRQGSVSIGNKMTWSWTVMQSEKIKCQKNNCSRTKKPILSVVSRRFWVSWVRENNTWQKGWNFLLAGLRKKCRI